GADRGAVALGPGDGANRGGAAVPAGADDNETAVRQRGDTAAGVAVARADRIAVGRADNAVGGGDAFDGAAIGLGPGGGADDGAVLVPVGAADHVVTVGQDGDAAAAHDILVGRADDAVGGGDGTDRAAVGGAPGNRADHRGAVMPEGTADH